MDYEQLTELIVELELDDIADAVKEALEADKKDPFDILSALTAGMDVVGQRYDEEIYYLADLMLAAETMKVALGVLKPALASSEKVKDKVKVVIATVKGDNHDIGKNLLGILLMSEGFEVYDLGKDVDAETIVAKVKETGAGIVGLSSLLSMTVSQIEVVHEALKNAGLRDKVNLIVGGAPLSMDLAKRFGADDFAEDTIKGITHIKNLAGI